MTAAIQAGRREEHGQDRVRHLRLPVPRLLAAAALFLEECVAPARAFIMPISNTGRAGPRLWLDGRFR